MNYYEYTFEIGKLYISEHNGIIIGISPDFYQGEMKETDAIKFCAQEIEAYLKGDLRNFSFKHHQEGTDFQKEVWNTLQQIPFGIRVTYQDIAQKINNPRAYQAVGSACGKNQLLLVVPCHRIVPKNGSGGGFRMGVDVKKHLLEHEKDLYLKK